MSDQLVKWHLSNCGLILVHPFLVHLFKILEYVDANNTFKNEDLQQRAIQLMYFIATGETKFSNEAELAMCKIVCGFTIQQAIPKNIILNDEEMNTAQEMMHAVIEKWEKLKSTSIDGLRQTFLQRDGLLEEKDTAYQLTIESSGVDILLDFIPWNINMVQFPWMNTIIYISWR